MNVHIGLAALVLAACTTHQTWAKQVLTQPGLSTVVAGKVAASEGIDVPVRLRYDCCRGSFDS